ncbi:hypothetical protein Pr1d_26950 [Bythopirellula goksoeyrii]|uniref:Uncharacterized protein n=1 Tax=Bythopirellula goksoeyrii TaxID=1400387 RepID=A0A5B9Q8T0_9BACT|nr:hypothetical protein Pr1d_26950 [Bythopirellula goksoeyrii]
MPCLRASRTSKTDLSVPSTLIAAALWFSTVDTDSPRIDAISDAWQPKLINRNTSTWRGVSYGVIGVRLVLLHVVLK